MNKIPKRHFTFLEKTYEQEQFSVSNITNTIKNEFLMV